MASSEARVAANRRNAQRSSGPKTEAGKQRSRGNALKHGLSGAGVVLSAGDGPAVDAIEAELIDDLQPDGVIGENLVRRTAVLLVRLRRCEEHGHAATAHRVRHAVADFEDRRAAEVAALADRITSDPADAVRRLRRTPEGVDRLIGAWRAIRAEAAGSRPADDAGSTLADRVGALLGLRPDDEREPAEADLDRWCRTLDAETGTRDRLLARLDGEIAALRTLRSEVAEVAAADRAEAPARALFDDTASGQRARKYEAAAERGLFRALRELREARSAAPLPGPAPAVVAPSHEPTSAPVPVPPPPPSSTPPAPRAVAVPVQPAAPAPSFPAIPPQPEWRDWPLDDSEFDLALNIGKATPPVAKTNPTRRG